MLVGVASAADLMWDAPIGDVVGYTVYYTDNTSNYNMTVGNVTFITDMDTYFNLIPGRTYTFTVTAYNNLMESIHSNSVEHLMEATYTPPNDITPENLPSQNEPLNVGINP